MAVFNEQTGNKCYRDKNTFEFWCEVTKRDVNQFGPLELGLTQTAIYSIPADKYIDIVSDNDVII